MGKLKVLSGQATCDLLKANGFDFIRHGKGDHDIYQRVEEDTTYSVSVPMHREIAVGTLSSIIRQSGLARRIFETD